MNYQFDNERLGFGLQHSDTADDLPVKTADAAHLDSRLLDSHDHTAIEEGETKKTCIKRGGVGEPSVLGI